MRGPHCRRAMAAGMTALMIRLTRRVLMRTCWARPLYQAGQLLSSAQEKRATRAFMTRFSRPGTILERFLSRTAEALRYALLDAHRFHRHGLRIEAGTFRAPLCR